MNEFDQSDFSAAEPTPYQPPSEFGDPHLESYSSRPQGIIPIAVIAIVFALMAMLSGLGGAVGTLMTKSFVPKLKAMAEDAESSESDRVGSGESSGDAAGDDSAVEGYESEIVGAEDSETADSEAEDKAEALQKRMQDVQWQAMAVAEKYFWVNVISSVVLFVLGITMAIAAIMTLTGSPLGRKILVATFVLVLITDIVRAVPALLTQNEMFGLYGEQMPDLLETDDSLGESEREQIGSVIGTGFGVFRVIAIAFAVIWLLVKAAFYLYGRSYLNRPGIRQWFLDQRSIRTDPSGQFN